MLCVREHVFSKMCKLHNSTEGDMIHIKVASQVSGICMLSFLKTEQDILTLLQRININKTAGL